MQVWDGDTGELKIQVDVPTASTTVPLVAFSPDQRRFAYGDFLGIYIYDLETGEKIGEIPSFGGFLGTLLFSIDGNQIIYPQPDSSLAVYDITTGDIIQTLVGHTDNVTAVALSADGTRLVSAANDGTLYVWDMTTGSLLRIYEERTAGTIAVAFNADKNQIYVVQGDGKILTLRLETGLNLLQWVGRNRLLRPLTAQELVQYGLDGGR
jgi:WD40 repeat protein